MTKTISNDAYSARLLDFISESLVANQRPDGDARTLLGALVAQYGHDGLFHGAHLDTRAATRALAAALPPLRTGAATDGPDQGYGYGSISEFNKLPAETRLRVLNSYEFRKAEAAAEVKRVKDRDELTAALPPDWSGYTDAMKRFWLDGYDAEKRKRDETEAEAVKLRKAQFAAEKAARGNA